MYLSDHNRFIPLLFDQSCLSLIHAIDLFSYLNYCLFHTSNQRWILKFIVKIENRKLFQLRLIVAPNLAELDKLKN